MTQMGKSLGVLSICKQVKIPVLQGRNSLATLLAALRTKRIIAFVVMKLPAVVQQSE